MRMVVRYFSLVLIVIALMLLGADVITSLEKDAITVRSLAQFWGMVDQDSLNGFKGWLEHTLPASVASAIEYCLNVYSWLPFGALGVILEFAFGRRHAEE
jgi:hypothetical protein